MKIPDKKKIKELNRLRRFNKHINFNLEGTKTNARKGYMTVFCCKCKKKTALPFKPRNPEVYCDECFKDIKKKRF